MEQWVSPRGIFFSDTREKKINNLLRKMPESRPRLHPKAHSLACWLENCPLDALFMLSGYGLGEDDDDSPFKISS